MRERGHGRTTNGPACTGWMQFEIIIILVKLLVIVRTYTRKRMVLMTARACKVFIEVNISFKLISPWQNSGSRLILSTKPVGAQSVFELDASSDNGSEIKENRLPLRT